MLVVFVFPHVRFHHFNILDHIIFNYVQMTFRKEIDASSEI
jgi:hypothetical protein